MKRLFLILALLFVGCGNHYSFDSLESLGFTTISPAASSLCLSKIEVVDGNLDLAAEEALGFWRGFLGREYLVLDSTSPNIIIFYDSTYPYADFTTGFTKFLRDDEQNIVCHIFMGTDDASVLAHEIGHCLGLTHPPTNLPPSENLEEEFRTNPCF